MSGTLGNYTLYDAGDPAGAAVLAEADAGVRQRYNRGLTPVVRDLTTGTGRYRWGTGIDVTPGGPPMTATATITAGTKVRVAWTAPDITPDDLWGYNVYHVVDGEEILLNDAVVEALLLDVPAPVLFGTYRVKTVDFNGNESTAASAEAGVPTTVAAVNQAGVGISVSWDANADADGFNVYHSLTLGGTYTKLTVTPDAASPYVDATPTVAQHFYKVSAVDADGNESALSAAVNATYSAT